MRRRLRRELQPGPGGIAQMLRRRQGMTLLEVLLTLAIFLVGSVGIIGLFVAASVLHKDAVERRTASYIAETLLANVQAKPMNEVFAKTTLINPGGPPPPALGVTISVQATNTSTALNLIAGFSVPRPLLLQSEQRWAGSMTPPTNVLPPPPPTFTLDLAPTALHPDGSAVLQPLTWRYVLSAALAANSPGPVLVLGNPTAAPAAPASGFLVIDKEWMSFGGPTSAGAPDASGFYLADLDGNGVRDRGFGLTVAAPHNLGSPVTVAEEYPGYPGFYYTVQYYPVNATGAEARVIVMVGFGTQKRFHVEAFEGVYTPGQY